MNTGLDTGLDTGLIVDPATPAGAPPGHAGFASKRRRSAHVRDIRSDDLTGDPADEPEPPVEVVVTGVTTMETTTTTSYRSPRSAASAGRTRRRRVAVIAAATLITAGGGTAWALWSATGTGAGQAGALTAQNITVTAAAGPASLFPGTTDGDITFLLTNPNPYPVQLTSMTPGTITSSNPGACPASNVTVDATTGLALNVAAGATTGTQTIADVVNMAAAAPDGCQGVTFTIQLTLSGSQV